MARALPGREGRHASKSPTLESPDNDGNANSSVTKGDRNPLLAFGKCSRLFGLLRFATVFAHVGYLVNLVVWVTVTFRDR